MICSMIELMIGLPVVWLNEWLGLRLNEWLGLWLNELLVVWLNELLVVSLNEWLVVCLNALSIGYLNNQLFIHYVPLPLRYILLHIIRNKPLSNLVYTCMTFRCSGQVRCSMSEEQKLTNPWTSIQLRVEYESTPPWEFCVTPGMVMDGNILCFSAHGFFR